MFRAQSGYLAGVALIALQSPALGETSNVVAGNQSLNELTTELAQKQLELIRLNTKIGGCALVYGAGYCVSAAELLRNQVSVETRARKAKAAGTSARQTLRRELAELDALRSLASPTAVKPMFTAPTAMRPASSEPMASESAATESAATELAASESAVSDSTASQPLAIRPTKTTDISQ